MNESQGKIHENQHYPESFRVVRSRSRSRPESVGVGIGRKQRQRITTYDDTDSKRLQATPIDSGRLRTTSTLNDSEQHYWFGFCPSQTRTNNSPESDRSALHRAHHYGGLGPNVIATHGGYVVRWYFSATKKLNGHSYSLIVSV